MYVLRTNLCIANRLIFSVGCMDYFGFFKRLKHERCMVYGTICPRYHGDKNVMAMLGVVEPLHEELLKGANTLKEESFQASPLGRRPSVTSSHLTWYLLHHMVTLNLICPFRLFKVSFRVV